MTETQLKAMFLAQRQSLPLHCKVEMTLRRIRQWYEYWDGNVSVEVSGKDSGVLLHLVRSLYSEVPAVWCNTGLEYPEIKSWVKTIDNVDIVKPEKTFIEVVKKYGFPIIGKTTAMGFDRYKNTTSEEQKNLRLHGGTNPSSGKLQERSIAKKWHFLLDAPFDISDRCCYYLKKHPLEKYEKKTGRKPFVGTMAGDSNERKKAYIRTGCNSFDGTGRSTPLSFWLEKDIWEFIKQNNVSYSKIYDERIIEETGEKVAGEDRTGCMFCGFGIIQESKKGLNRFQRMAKSHPTHYDICINKIGLGAVLDYIGIDYEPKSDQEMECKRLEQGILF